MIVVLLFIISSVKKKTNPQHFPESGEKFSLCLEINWGGGGGRSRKKHTKIQMNKSEVGQCVHLKTVCSALVKLNFNHNSVSSDSSIADLFFQ